ncbi:putative porin [Paraburkholderia sp. BL23I1N1]|uniref:porin n=1 Tax=unclassified Paraburkholderia TaxID=2615204 RepID=UPI000E75D96B|nr:MULTISPECIES: porin [unclassified Paraburkholderia]RKE23885.1 putative porin [Paraburkholderia sp. BL23I1N1]TDY15561.1 putative porin [Paraburkholderia sp. BL6665CI2N2]
MSKRLAVAGIVVLTAQPTYAQSSVTLYGLIDDGITYVNNVQTAGTAGRKKASQTYLASSILAGSRWGIRAVEDLGGGMRTIVVLESGWDMNTGRFQQGGDYMGRQVYIGLGNSVGTVTLGRQYDLLLDFNALTTSNPWGSGYTAHISDLDNLSGTYRVNNAIKFKTQPYHGVVFGFMYSLGGIAGDVTRNQQLAVGTTYVNGPFYGAMTYLAARNPNISVYGNTPSAGPATTNNIGATTLTGVQGNPAISGYASAHSKDIFAVGMNYKIGGGTLYANYSNVRFSGLGDTSAGPNPFGYQGTAVFNTAELDYSYYVTPAFMLGGGYVFTKGTGPNGNNAKYHQPQVTFDYFLSKRTDIYGALIYQKATGRDSTGQQAVASITAITPSTSDRQFAAHVAIRHTF